MKGRRSERQGGAADRRGGTWVRVKGKGSEQCTLQRGWEAAGAAERDGACWGSGVFRAACLPVFLPLYRVRPAGLHYPTAIHPLKVLAGVCWGGGRSVVCWEVCGGPAASLPCVLGGMAGFWLG